MSDNGRDREQWGSRLGFILATVGSAVGLGNVWRFPTIVSRSGGGAFLLMYALIVIGIGMPLMMAELAMGRKSKSGVLGSFRAIGGRQKWWMGGIAAGLACFLILSYYSVIAGWTILYTFFGAAGELRGLDSDGLLQLFSTITEETYLPVLGQLLFLTISSSVVYLGVTDGIEKWGKILMPSITALLLLLLGRVLFVEGALDGVRWFLRPDFGQLTFPVALEAMGQVFFSFSLGMGAVLTYGSYLSDEDDITTNSLIISFADVGVAILAGLVVISALFAFDIEPEVGFGLVFVALPSIFNTMPGSQFWIGVFFLALSFAALTSLISFLEVLIATLMEEFDCSRPASALTVAIGVFVAGLPSALAHNVFENVTFFGQDILGAVDELTSSLILPISGIITVIFVAWIWGINNGRREIAGPNSVQNVWGFIISYISPIILVVILISGFIL